MQIRAAVSKPDTGPHDRKLTPTKEDVDKVRQNMKRVRVNWKSAVQQGKQKLQTLYTTYNKLDKEVRELYAKVDKLRKQPNTPHDVGNKDLKKANRISKKLDELARTIVEEDAFLQVAKEKVNRKVLTKKPVSLRDRLGL